MKIIALTLIVCLPSLGRGMAAEATPAARKAPVFLELRDQYDAPQVLAFPTTNLVVLAIADRKGAEEVDGWVAALKSRYAGRIELRGLADVGGVPGWMRGKVRQRFQETRPYPVMMDWSGTNGVRFGAQPGVANVLVLAPDGAILSSQRGPADEKALRAAFQAIDAASALSGPARSALTNKP